MEASQARVIVSVAEGRIEIEGSEQFVQAQLEAFREQIALAFTSARPVDAPGTGKSAHANPAGQAPPPAQGLAGYDNLFALADDKIQILKDLPGGSKAEKMVNAALLLCFACELTGRAPTASDAIRALCQAHGTLDGKNFSKTLKAEKDAFVFTGTNKKNQLVALTVPGRKRAETLALGLKV